MRWLLLWASLVLLAVVVTSQPRPSEDFPHFVILDSRNENVWLYWKLDGIYITFEIHGKTTGWVGMGISPNGGMIGADIYVGWVKDGVATITDRHGVSRNTFPPMAEEQNLRLLGGEERDGWTRIKFRREIAGCEQGVDMTITTSTLRIIWALGTSDPEGDDIDAGDYHGGSGSNRGTRSVFILEATGVPTSNNNEETESLELLNGGISIPNQDTYYNCKLVEIPPSSQKRHVIRIEPVIQAGNEDLVHHVLLYLCGRNPTNASNIGRSHECYVRNMPADFRSCSLTIHAWAIGGGIFYFPNHVGFPIGATEEPIYVMMETHYDNPTLRSGISDNSGLRFVHTNNLRQYDAGILEIGRSVTPSLSLLVPPNSENFHIFGECGASCIGGGMKAINRRSIQVFGGLLHSHLLGRAMRVRHFAQNNSFEKPFLLEDNSYDFNYQEVKIFSQEVTVIEGESLQMMCDYNSMGSGNFTLGGLSTQNEMCLAYIYYYPRLPVTSCRSYPYTDSLLEFFNVTEVSRTFSPYVSLDDITVLRPEHLSGQTLSSVMNQVEWNQATIEEFQQFTQKIRYRINNCEGVVEIDSGLLVDFPVVANPYQPLTPMCINATPPPITTTSSSFFLRGSMPLVSTTVLTLVTLWF